MRNYIVLVVLGLLIQLAACGSVKQWLVDLVTPWWPDTLGGVTPWELDSQPLHGYALPTYGNWSSDQGWSVYARGFAFKKPPMSDERVDKIANIPLKLGNARMEDLPPWQRDHARQFIRQFVISKRGFVPVGIRVSLEREWDGNYADIGLPHPTSLEGDFHEMVRLPTDGNPDLSSGEGLTAIQQLAYRVQSDLTPGNETDLDPANSVAAPVYLVPPTGLTFISDIDDVLRVAKMWRTGDTIFETVANVMRPWLNMPDVFQGWARRWPSAHFHYVSTTLEQNTPRYLEMLMRWYPRGSVSTRPTDIITGSREWGVLTALQSFPNRRFVLVGDTTNEDAMEWYPKLERMFPYRVSCILIRDTATTEPTDDIPYSLEAFKNVPRDKFMLFKTPDDLVGIDFEKGECNNGHGLPPDFGEHKKTPNLWSSIKGWFWRKFHCFGTRCHDGFGWHKDPPMPQPE